MLLNFPLNYCSFCPYKKRFRETFDCKFQRQKVIKMHRNFLKLTTLFVRILTTLLHVIIKSRVKMTGGNILSNQYRWEKGFCSSEYSS